MTVSDETAGGGGGDGTVASYAAIGDSFTEGMGDELPDGTPRGWADLVALGLAHLRASRPVLLGLPAVVAFYGDSYPFGTGATDLSVRWSTVVSDERGWREYTPSSWPPTACAPTTTTRS